MDGGAATKWSPGLLDTGPDPVLPDPEEIARLEREREIAAENDRGYEAGYAKGLIDGRGKGHEEGFASGRREVERLTAQISGILDSFHKPLSRLDDEVVEALQQVAVRVAGALLQREYERDPTVLSELIGQALDEVSDLERDVELRLHPDDLGVLTPFLSSISVRMVHDTSLARGDLRVHSENLRIDGSLATRLQLCLQALTGTGTAP